MKIILVSHDGLASAMLRSAEMIIGDQPNVSAFGIEAGEDLNEDLGRLRAVVAEARETGELIVLSDLLHGTPFNFLVQLSRDYQFLHITGMNLTLVIDILSNLDEGTTTKIINQAIENGRAGLLNVNKLLEGDE